MEKGKTKGEAIAKRTHGSMHTTVLSTYVKERRSLPCVASLLLDVLRRLSVTLGEQTHDEPDEKEDKQDPGNVTGAPG